MTWTYFTDRDLGKQFPAILAEAALSAERHADLFPPDGSDEQCSSIAAGIDESRSRTTVEFGTCPMSSLPSCSSRARFTAQPASGFVTSVKTIKAFLALNTPPYEGIASGARMLKCLL